MDSSGDLSGIDVPKSLATTTKEEPIMTNNTLIGVALAKSVFEIVVSQRPGKWVGDEAVLATVTNAGST